jgi:integral membrane protein
MTLEPRNLFRAVAIAESVSWAGLLVGMYFKRVAETTDLGVVIFGPIHGVIFLAYVIAVFCVRRSFGWNTRTFVVAGLASLPPFATLVFEVWADRRNLLRTVSSASGGVDGANIPNLECSSEHKTLFVG